MTQDWDHYLCKLGEDVASIYLDLELARDKITLMESHPHLVAVSVTMLRAQANGMSSDEEFDDLISLEDDLGARTRIVGGIYAGRLTSRGRRIFYFYAQAPADVEGAVEDLMRMHSSYVAEVTSRPDPQWSAYFDLLYPSPADYQRIMNRRLN